MMRIYVFIFSLLLAILFTLSLFIFLSFFLVFLFLACTLFHSRSLAHSRVVQMSVFSRASKNYDRYFLTQYFNTYFFLSLSLFPSSSHSLSFSRHTTQIIGRCTFHVHNVYLNFLKKRNETHNRGTRASSCGETTVFGYSPNLVFSFREWESQICTKRVIFE